MSKKIGKSQQAITSRLDRWKTLNKQFVVYVPVLISAGILVLVAYLPLNISPAFLLSLICFVAGFSGILVIRRREIPTGFYVIKGKIAVIEGAIAVILLWGVALYFILFGLK